MASPGLFRTTYDLAFQVSPIILVDGIAANSIGGMLPIIALYGQLGAFAQGVLTDGSDPFFARYVPIPGSTLINNTIGTYPFANQQVAANAIIQQPLNISLMMIAPVKDTSGYLTKLATFTALQNSLQQHNALGGRYHIATPSFVYTDCLMTSVTDITSGEGNQKQIQYQLDFTRPLVTKQQAATAYNGQFSRIANGQPVGTSPSGVQAITGPAQGITPATAPSSYGSVINYGQNSASNALGTL